MLQDNTNIGTSIMNFDFYRRTKMAADNVRFGASGAVTPQTILYEIARYYPAASLVEAATSQSRWDVRRHPRAMVRFSRIKKLKRQLENQSK